MDDIDECSRLTCGAIQDLRHTLVGTTIHITGVRPLKRPHGSSIVVVNCQDGMRYSLAYQPSADRLQSSESRLYTIGPETKAALRKFRLSTSRAKDAQAVICTG